MDRLVHRLLGGSSGRGAYATLRTAAAARSARKTPTSSAGRALWRAGRGPPKIGMNQCALSKDGKTQGKSSSCGTSVSHEATAAFVLGCEAAGV
jgi:hypothetical protein